MPATPPFWNTIAGGKKVDGSSFTKSGSHISDRKSRMIRKEFPRKITNCSIGAYFQAMFRRVGMFIKNLLRSTVADEVNIDMTVVARVARHTT